MSYRFKELEIGENRERGWFILLHCLSWKIDSSWGVIRQVHIYLVCDTYIRVGCCGKITTWGRRGYNIIQMVIDLL